MATIYRIGGLCLSIQNTFTFPPLNAVPAPTERQFNNWPGYRVHALDMPGFGRSPSCPASPVDLVYELLKQEGITSPVFLKDAPHPCYLEQTDHWHRTLVGFLDEQGV